VVVRLPGGSDDEVAAAVAGVQRLLHRIGPVLATTATVTTATTEPPRPPPPPPPPSPPPDPPPATDRDGDLRELVARGAHDLRTPLNTLAGMVDTLVKHGDELAPATRAELHTALQRSTRRVAGWITSLLDAAVDEGSRTSDHVLTPLQPLLEEAVAITQAATVGLRVEVPTTDLYVFADPGSVVRVVSNLLANAGHHGGEGGSVEVDARARDREVEVSVRDHGAGWEQAVPGAGAGGDGRTHRSGLGLGLESVRAQVTDWGGEVSLEETPGGGATVRFTLPRARAGTGDTSAGGPGATGGGNWTIAGRESLLRGVHRTR
jgi:K+-sensing histidine kinase KdpD